MADLAQRVRASFPALAQSKLALFDNAGGTCPCTRTIDLIAEYLAECPVQLGADYPMSLDASARLDAAHTAVATLFSTRGDVGPDNLVFGSSTTDLIGKLAAALTGAWSPGDEIVVTNFDHEANIGAWRRLADRGLIIREWRIDEESLAAEPARLAELLSERTRLVAFTHASNIIGTALPVRELCTIVRAAGALSMVDGVGYAPHRPLDVRDWGCDFYVFSLYKVYGPHCAVLYGRRDALAGVGNLNHEFHAGGPPALRLTPGAYPYELAASARGVCDYLDELGAVIGADRRAAWEAISEHEDALVTSVLDGLAQHDNVRVIGAPDANGDRLPIISFVAEGRSSKSIALAFQEHGIALRYGHFYAPRLLRVLGLEPADGVVRLSLAHYNSQAEVERFRAGLANILRQ